MILFDRRALEDYRRAREWITALGRSDIRLVRAPRVMNLGGLRELSMELARGAIACLWDDDDLSGSRRLELQGRQLISQGSGAVYLERLPSEH